MSEATATPATPATPTEGATTEAAATTSLLSSTEGAASTPPDPAAAAAATAEPGTEGAAPAEGAAPVYEFKAPEGKPAYDPAVLEPFTEAAKAANLKPDDAQKILETMAPKLVERQAAQVAAIQTGWLEASKADPEFGGDKLPENMALAKRTLDTFAPNNPDGTVSGLRKLLDDTGLGNNPEVLRMLVRVGKAISEDGFVAGMKPASAEKSAAELLYGATTKSA